MERKFSLVDPSLISCSNPCNEEHVRLVENNKIKQVPDATSTKRCVAQGAALRGQHYAGVTETQHLANLPACRVCTVYTKIDNAQG